MESVSLGAEGYQLYGNIDQQWGGVQVFLDGGRSWHPRDYTENWQLIATDVETTGCNPKKQTPVHHARVHSFSIAYFPTNVEYGLRGQPLAKRVFFLGPPEGLAAEALCDRSIGKVMHQAHYDRQSYLNHGLDVGCCLDTLRLSKLLAPHSKNHKLKFLMRRDLGYELGDFGALFSRPTKGVKGQDLKKREMIPLDTIPMFSPLGCCLVDYASLDSKGTLEECVMLSRQVAARKTYRLPDFVSYYYGIEPGWLAILRRLNAAI